MQKYIRPISVITSLLIVGVLGYLSIEVLGNYGWTVFLISPFLTGFIPVYWVSRSSKMDLAGSYLLGLSTLLLAALGLLVFAIEGLICIIMGLPIFVLCNMLGAYLGFKLNQKKWLQTKTLGLILVLISISTLSFDYVNEPKDLIPVRTSVIVHAPIDKVWENVVTFDKIEEPTDWLFKTGISYPTDATIQGHGVGAIRYCNFTTGSFVEPITTWNAPTLLQFDVAKQPTPMNEFNPFWDVAPKHLDGYFVSHKGQFKLNKIDDNTTELEGTTWYTVDITPELYWKTWSDFIIHRIHKRVLNHIKLESES